MDDDQGSVAGGVGFTLPQNGESALLYSLRNSEGHTLTSMPYSQATLSCMLSTACYMQQALHGSGPSTTAIYHILFCTTTSTHHVPAEPCC